MPEDSPHLMGPLLVSGQLLSFHWKLYESGAHARQSLDDLGRLGVHALEGEEALISAVRNTPDPEYRHRSGIQRGMGCVCNECIQFLNDGT